MIDFVNAVSVPFVLLAIVVIGAPIAAYIARAVADGRRDARQKLHDERMLSTETGHRETMAKLNPALPGDDSRRQIARATTISDGDGE